jgi:hypothetical protein
MYNKSIIMICLVFSTIIYSAEKKGNSKNIQAPSYDCFIGKNFVKINEIDSAISAGQFGALYKDGSYSICIYGNDHYLDKWRNSRFNYLFFTKQIGRQGTHSIKKILDIITLDMDDFGDSASIWLDECECKGNNGCQTVAIYNQENKLVKNGKKIKPIKVWIPNIATGKLEEQAPEGFRCGPQEPEEE